MLAGIRMASMFRHTTFVSFTGQIRHQWFVPLHRDLICRATRMEPSCSPFYLFSPGVGICVYEKQIAINEERNKAMAEIVDERRGVQPPKSPVNRGRVWSPDGGCQTSKRTIIPNWGSDAKKSRAASNLSSNTRLSMRQVIYLSRWKAGLITRTAATVNTMHPW